MSSYGKDPATPEKESVLLYLLMGALALLFLAAGYYFKQEFHLEFVSHLLTEIGIAWLVAIILAFTVEYASRKRDERRFNAEKEGIKNDVFQHVLGYRLPHGTFVELDNQILRAPFIREDATCFYRLIALTQENEKFMKVEGTLTYTIVNRTPERQPFLFTTIIENAPIEKLNQFVKFTSVNVKGCEVPIALNTEDEINNEVNTVKRPNHKSIEKPISISGNGSASAVVKFESVKSFEGGFSFLLNKLQTVGFSLKVEAPPEVEVLADSYLREPLGEGSEHYPKNNTYHWVLKNPILPYQGVYVTWKSKTAQSQQRYRSPEPTGAVKEAVSSELTNKPPTEILNQDH